MGNLTSSVSFDKVAAFEREIKAKIIIFHHTAGRKRLACYKTHEISRHTVWLYLQDNHYYLIENPAGFFGSAYVWNYCYETYEAVKRDNGCQGITSVLHSAFGKEKNDKYLVFEFETRYHNGRHEANFCCVKDLDGKNMYCFPGLNCVKSFVDRY